MQKIDKVVLQNVQSHEATTLDLSPGFNVITGSTEGGKTAIMRGDRLLVDNKPAGTAWVRKDKNDEPVGTLTVIHEYASGHKVARVRGKSVNRYIITDPDGTTKTLEGFGTDVPEEVQAITGIRPAVFFDDGKGKSFAPVLNFAFQLEAPFMLSETPGLGAKVFGHLAGTGIVDAALDDLNKDVFDANKRKRVAEDEIGQKEAALKGYDGLEQVRAQYDRSEVTFNAVLADVDSLKRLGTLAAELGKADADLIRVKAVLAALDGLQQAETTLVRVAAARNKLDCLEDLRGEALETDINLACVNETLDALAGLQRAETTLLRLRINKSVHDDLTGLSDSYNRAAVDLNKVTLLLSTLRGLNALENALEGIKANQDRVARLGELAAGYRATEAGLEECYQIIFLLDQVPEAGLYLQQLQEKVARIDLLTELSTKYTNNEGWLDVVKYDLRLLEGLDQAKERFNAVQEAQKRLTGLAELSRLTDTLTSQLTTVKERLAALGEPEKGALVLSQVREDFDRGNRLTTLKHRYLLLQDDYEAAAFEAGTAEAEVKDAEAEYQQILQEAGVCPTCGQEIKGGLICGH